jgi:hypothetical protein
MAARRLIALMIVLLGISTALAILAPRDSNDPTPTTAEAPHKGQPASSGGHEQGFTSEEPAGDPGEKHVHLKISNAPPPTIHVLPGQQLILNISGSFGDDVEIPGFGLVETVTPFAPAVFDFNADETGTFGVDTVESHRHVARIVVGAVPPNPKPKPKRGSGSSGSGSHGVKGRVPVSPKPQ